jgi:ribosomal protein S18 acetylase RimI-like enzyme
MDNLSITVSPTRWKIVASNSESFGVYDASDNGMGYATLRQDIDGRMSIWGVFVNPEYRRQGVATALMEECLCRARILNRIVWLKVRARNEAAIGLYHKMGFTDIEVVEANDSHTKQVIMERRLE